MKVLIFTLLFCSCCQVFGRPSDPVVREFGTQPNNPNVKVFSTYPTVKPPVIKDNPNDLEKGPDQEKYEKDEREVDEAKGEEITKVQSNLTDVKVLDTSENVTEENALMSSSSAGKSVYDAGSDFPIMSENEKNNSNTEDMSEVPAEDGVSMNETNSNSADNLQETNNSDLNPQVEIIGDQNSRAGIMPVMEEVVSPISEYDIVGRPLVIDAPATTGPYISEEFGEIPEGEILFAIPKMDLNDDEVYELNEESPFLNIGVILPELVSMEAASDAGNEGEIIPLKVESTTLSPIAAEELESNSDANAQFPREVSDAKQPVAEINGDVFEPMASLTEESLFLEPIAESEGEESIPYESHGSFNGESIATGDNAIDSKPMEESDLGVSVSMIEEIPPIVEVEPESPSDSNTGNTEENIGLGVQVNKDSEVGNKENSTFETVVDEPTDQSIQMAGFMSDASKSSPESEQTTEESLPSATDLSLTLNINDTENVGSSTDSKDTQISTQMEPMDQLDVIDSQQPSSPTEETVPTLNPMELTANEEVNEDPTLNEAI